MSDVNDFLYKELLNLPFNLYKIISEYIATNKNEKVAFVGGYLRDLLIWKIHKGKKFKPIDLDIVVEGSAINLAIFIKKNIKNVELCLIKEFNLYKTIEVNVNNLKIDIASAREEIYPSPGFNPIIKDSNILDDLKRRDFTINTLAFEISTKELIDIHNGLNHIRAKKLHLLHNESIKDDPSRLLRCAKYSSRLGFRLDENSLKQAQKFIFEWPWDVFNVDSKRKIPPGISIRLRMELSEIIRHDNLSKIIKILHEWQVLSIINEDITLNTKFIRGLHWVQRLNGKPILYLTKDSKSLESLGERLFLNTKDLKIIQDYFLIKNKLIKKEEKFLNFSPSNWTEFIEEKNLDLETVKLIIGDGGRFWRHFLRWLITYRNIKSDKNGKLLKEEGWKPGKEMGDELKRLRYIEIDNLRKH